MRIERIGSVPVTHVANWKPERILHLECALGHTWSESSYDDRRCPFCHCVALEVQQDDDE